MNYPSGVKHNNINQDINYSNRGMSLEEELNSLYWDRINVSYSNEFYKNYTNNTEEDESFPMAISQLFGQVLVIICFFF